jgi:DNA polymerase-1
MLSRLTGEFAQSIARIEHEIAKLAGEEFNPGSAKQLGDILFGKMKLPGATKTSSGAWSTRANILGTWPRKVTSCPRRFWSGAAWPS